MIQDIREPSGDEKSVEVRDVSFGFGTNTILSNLSFSIQTGDYVGIVGPNGGGKTTLLKLLLGLLEPSAGTVTILGQNPIGSSVRSQVGYVPQRLASDTFTFPATVFEVVRSGLVPRKGVFARFGNKDEILVDQSLALAKVSHIRDQLFGTLSGGERQRVMIARALVSSPRMLILDEPTTGVDPASQEDFYDFVRLLNHDHNITIIFVTHDLDVVAKEARTVLCVNRELVSHSSVIDFDQQAIWDHLYGKSARVIHHHH